MTEESKAIPIDSTSHERLAVTILDTAMAKAQSTESDASISVGLSSKDIQGVHLKDVVAKLKAQAIGYGLRFDSYYDWTFEFTKLNLHN